MERKHTDAFANESIKVPFFHPSIDQNDKKYVLKALEAPLLTDGPKLREFEKKFSKFAGVRYAVGVSNGTDGLKLALQTFNLTENDLVIMPTNTFVADYLAVKHLPLVKPKVALIDHDEYFTINTAHLELFLKGYRRHFNKVVVIPVHLYGHSCDMDTIMKLSKEYNFNVIEDCSQSHETKYKGNYLG